MRRANICLHAVPIDIGATDILSIIAYTINRRRIELRAIVSP